MLGYILLFFLIATLCSLLLTPWIIKLAYAFDVVRYPPSYYLKRLKAKGISVDPFKLEAAKRRLEKPPTPEWGGITYIVVFLLVSAIGLLISKQINLGAEVLMDYIWWGFGILVLLINGILDDKFELPSFAQIFAYVLASLLFVFSNFSVAQVNLPFLENIAIDQYILKLSLGSVVITLNIGSDLIIFAFLLYMIMALKVQAGTDAVMETNTFVALLLLLFISYKSGLYTTAFLASVLAGALLGFIFYNWYPARIWSGESGDAVIGYVIGTFAIIGRVNLSAVLILFAIPIVDFAYVLLKRLKRVLKTHKKVWLIFKMSDRNHLHHRLLAAKIKESYIPFIEGIYTLALGVSLYFVPRYLRNEFLVVVYLITFFVIVLVDLWARRRGSFQDYMSANKTR